MTADKNNTTKQTIYTGLEARDEERVIPGWNKVTDTFKVAKSKVSDALDKELDDVISNPNLKMLGDYLDMFNRKYPAKRMSLVGSARQIWNTHKITKQLQAQQLTDWFRNGNSVDDVFKILKIGDEGPQFLASPKLFPFHDYIHLVNSKNLREKTNLFKALRNGFGDHKFATSISKATEMPSLQGRAVTYQDKLFKLTRRHEENWIDHFWDGRISGELDFDKVNALMSSKLSMDILLADAGSRVSKLVHEMYQLLEI
ncbi:RxLR effector protein [Phytophthora megakarya]|uniref:RxLR effector protein n=1 Tax=Phytophthora megakarya TaxID=4795 RepID=A0A225VDJ7_9STRA|nr:RxLR effector protein [Phytophthora megakarya]